MNGSSKRMKEECIERVGRNENMKAKEAALLIGLMWVGCGKSDVIQVVGGLTIIIVVIIKIIAEIFKCKSS